MAPTVYKNSKLATVFSVLGYLAITGGVYFLFNDEPVAGLISLVIGFILHFLEALISKKKKKKEVDSNQSFKQ